MKGAHPQRKLTRDIARMQRLAERRRPLAEPRPPLPDPILASFEIVREPTIVRTVREDNRLRRQHWIDCALRVFPLGLAIGICMGVWA